MASTISTSFITFGIKKIALAMASIAFLNSIELSRTSSVGYLDLDIDEKLRWSVHTKFLSQQVAKYSGLYFGLRKFVTK